MSQSSTLKGQCIAEFLGTGLLIFFGVGCVAALKVAGASFGQWEISIIWGLGVAMAIYLTAGVSGAHLNPAVTIALWLFACFDGRKVIPFIVAQFAGAFCAAALVYGLYYNLFIDFEHTHNMVRGSVESLELAGIFSTYPNPHINFVQAFAVEMVITAILMGVILALTDDRRAQRHQEIRDIFAAGEGYVSPACQPGERFRPDITRRVHRKPGQRAH